MDEELESLKGLSRSETLFPRLPLKNPETGRRQDSRDPSDVRPIFLQTGVRKGAKGSAYIELGTTKVICVISGPKDPPKKVEFSNTGLISVEVQLVGGKVPGRDITLIKECMEAVILLDKFPKLILEIYLTIMEDGGSAMAACITAAGMALIEAGIPMFDTLVGSTLLYDGKDFYLDPTKEEVECVDLTDQEKNDRGGGLVTMGYLPSREQICLFSMEGKMDPVVLENSLEALTSANLKLYSVVRKQSSGLLKDQLNNGSS